MSLLRWLAAPLSPFYGAVVRLRNRTFDAHPERSSRVAARVISIGNLSTGGTGKKPLTLLLAESLQATGWTNVVISRGYGGRRDFDVMDVGPESAAAQVGDEPLLMARRLGAGRVVVARKRAAGATRALALQPSTKVLLLDDGFQHRALHRDLDLLVLDPRVEALRRFLEVQMWQQVSQMVSPLVSEQARWQALGCYEALRMVALRLEKE
mgnify:CR=1 FL=1